MKKILSAFLGLAVFLSMLSPISFIAYADGEGTEDNPYIITSDSEFNAIRNNPTAYYVLKADIILPDDYIPFEFSGSLVGDRVDEPYSITVDISASSSYSSPVGLFTIIKNAEIKNLALKGKISGYAYVGGFFGRNAEDSKLCVLENLINYASVTGKGTYVGGIGAVVTESTEASRLVNSGYIKANGNAGGLFGSAYNISMSANNGYVEAEGDYAGGIVSEAKGSITEAYNSGYVSASGSSGGIAGTVSEAGVLIENCFNTGNIFAGTAGVNSAGGILGGIKRFPDVNVKISNCYNYGNVPDPGYINSQYIEYDTTNYITLNNCYYNSVSDTDLQGATEFTSTTGLASKLSASFTDDAEKGIAVLKNISYLEYAEPAPPAADAPVVEEIKTTFVKEAEFLKALGVIDTISDFEKKVTRGEFADLISRVYLYNQQYVKENIGNAFYDVGPAYAYYDGVRIISDLKIMTPDSFNRFYPDREITGNEAVTALIRTTGYEVYAKAQGGYPSGYLYQAKLNGLINGISGIGSDVINMETVVKLLYNSLFVNVVTSNGIDSDGGEHLQIHPSINYLSSIHNVYKYDSVLTDNGYTGSSNSYEEAGQVVITDYETGAVKIIKADKGITSFIGQRIEVFLKERDGYVAEALFYSTSKFTEVTKLSGRDIVTINASGITVEEKNSSRNKIISFNSSKLPLVYINGTKTINYKYSDIMADDAVVFAINNNDDGYIDYLNVYKYSYDVIAGVISDNKTIYPYQGSAYELNLNEDKVIYAFTLDSMINEYSHIQQGDVISVAKSGITKNNKSVIFLTVSREKAEGSFDSCDNEYVTVGGVDYLVSNAMKNTYINYKTDIEFGTQVTVFINNMGEASYVYNGVVSGRKYGFVLNAAQTSGFVKRGLVRLLTDTGSVISLYLADNVRRENVKVTDLASFVTELKNSNDSLISYQLNDKNEILNVEFAKNATSDEAFNMSNFTLRLNLTTSSRYSGITLGGIGANNTLVFVVPVSYKEDGSDSSVKKNYFARTSYYGGVTDKNVKFYDVEQNGVAKAALYRPASIAADFSSEPDRCYIFKKLVKAFDEENGAVDKIYYYDVGVEKSVLVDPEAEIITHTSLETSETVTISSLSDLKPGDLFCFETNIDGNLKVIAPILKIKDFGASGDGIWFIGGTGTANNYTLSVFEGILQYKSSSAMTVRFNSSNYAVEPFTYASGNIAIYKISRATGNLTIGSEADLTQSNFLTGVNGDMAIFIASKNTLREVIIYE